GAQELVSIGNLGDIVEAPGVKGSSPKDEDGGVDKEGKTQSQRGVEDSVVQGFAAISNRGSEGPSLNDARVEIKIVRHHRSAQNADSDVEHFAIAKDFDPWEEAGGGLAPERPREKDFVGETHSDRSDERDDEGFDKPEAAALQCEDNENIHSGDKNA